MSKSIDAIKNSTAIFNGLMIIGFLGIVWLMIYGNLSGNLGFEQTSSSFDNETINLTGGGDTPATAENRVDGSLSNIEITNYTGGEILYSGNYSISGVNISANESMGSDYLYHYVNVTGTVTYDSDADVRSEGVISNLTVGAGTFFSFSNTLFTITAIILLISILLGLLFLVVTIAKAFGGKGLKESDSVGASSFQT